MAARVCVTDGCVAPHLAKGLCSAHYDAQPGRRAASDARVALWRLTDEGQAARRRYRKSPEGKASQAASYVRYAETDNGRASAERTWLDKGLRRATKAGAVIGDIPADTRAILLARFGETCLVDGCNNAATDIDHVIALANGGVHDISNFQTLCGPCNKRKGTKTIDYRPCD